MNLLKRKPQNDALAPWYGFESSFDRLQREINNLFNDRFFPNGKDIMEQSFNPTLDVVENENYIEITCDLPGVDKSDIYISVSGNVLTIHGEKKGEEEKKGSKVYRKENWYGSFERSLTLPGYVDQEKIDAKMKNGVLKLSLPKREEAKRKKISVDVQ